MRTRWHRDESGQAIVLFAVGLLLIVTVIAVVLDVGIVATARTELEDATGQAALAGATRFAECPKPAAALVDGVRSRAREVASANAVAGMGLTLAPVADVEVGFTLPTTQAYTKSLPGEEYKANTVKITGRRSDAAPDGGVPLVMDGVLGTSESATSSQAWAIADGPGYINTDLALALNECGVLGAFGPGDGPVPYPLTVNIDDPSFALGSFGVRPFHPDARSYAVCPPPVTPVFPDLIASPPFSADQSCSDEILFTSGAIGFNLLCEGSAEPPSVCALLGDLFGEPFVQVHDDLLLHSSFLQPELAFAFSGGDLSQLIGEYVVPVYSSQEIRTFENFDLTSIFVDSIPLPPLELVSPVFGTLDVGLVVNLDWPSLPVAVRYAPTVGFAKYRVTSATPIMKTIVLTVRLDLGSCSASGGLCDGLDCCALLDLLLFPLDLELELPVVTGIDFDGEILRDQEVDTWLVGGVNFGISATGGTGPRLIDPSNNGN